MPAMWIAAVCLLAGCAAPEPAPDPPSGEAAGVFAEVEYRAPSEAYRQQLESWRRDRGERLVSEDGWLTLAGLYWLEHGENRFGSAPESELVFPAPAPAFAGTFHYDGVVVRLSPGAGVELTIEGEPVGDRVLADGTEGAPDVVRLDRLNFQIIVRGGRHAVRLKDPDSPARTDFAGLEYFPIDAAYTLDARLQPYDEPREVSLATVVETEAAMYSPGLVEFDLGGETYRLEGYTDSPEGAEQLFLIFKDTTSGDETYPAGRYLYAPIDGERVHHDFNKAYNPPCAFMSYATCPLPPLTNLLPVPIRAGEKHRPADTSKL
jgi:uncharacterized protein (DUF1684 family)